MRRLLLPAMGMLLTAACGADVVLVGGGEGGHRGRPTGVSTGVTSGGGSEGPPPAPPACMPPQPIACDGELSWTSYSVADLADPLVEDVAVLSTGTVLAAGYFGLLRKTADSDTFELVPTGEEAASSSFLQMEVGRRDDVWTSAHGRTAVSYDEGTTWSFHPDDRIAHVFPQIGGQEEIYHFGGEAMIGVATDPLGPITWTEVDFLDGDEGGYSVINDVMRMFEHDGTLLVSEFTGGSAHKRPDGDWRRAGRLPSGLDGVGAQVALRDGRVLAVEPNTGTIWVRCDIDDVQWARVIAPGTSGLAAPFHHQNFESRRLVRAADGRLYLAGEEGIQRSCDDGLTWETLPFPGNYGARQLAISPDGTTLVVGGFDAIHIASLD